MRGLVKHHSELVMVMKVIYIWAIWCW